MTFTDAAKLYQINKKYTHHKVLGIWNYTCKKCGHNQVMANEQALPLNCCPHCSANRPDDSAKLQQVDMFTAAPVAEPKTQLTMF